MKQIKSFFSHLFLGRILALVFRAFARAASKGQPTDPTTSLLALDAYIKEQMHRLNIPGVSLAVVDGDKIVHLRGIGRACPRGEVPSPQTPFFIGSLTKSFTALAVMQLVEAGKVELDAPIQKYLPWFRVKDPLATSQMTVRHLLNQTSGLPTLPGELVLTDFDDCPDATERQVRDLSTLKISRPVGSKCEYSNLNYNILGLVIEAASGESYSSYIQNHIFYPLGMQHSYTSKVAAKQHGLAMGYRHWFGHPVPATYLPIPYGSLPSGQLISSAEDIAHYLIAHLNAGRYENVEILSSSGIDELHRGVKEYNVMGISGGKYGMGWFKTYLNKKKIYSHAGNVPDFSAFMAIIPEQKKGLVILFNADPYGLPPITEEIGMGATALLADLQPAPIRLNFIQWIMRLLPLIPLLQIVNVFTTLRLLHRWQHNPASLPSIRHLWRHNILLPLIPNISLAAILVYLRSNGLLRFMSLFMPDLSWIARISGGFAGIWTILRTGLILRVLRRDV